MYYARSVVSKTHRTALPIQLELSLGTLAVNYAHFRGEAAVSVLVEVAGSSRAV